MTESSSQMSQFQQLEARSHTARTEVLEEQTTQAPVFTSSMKSIEVKEGQRAHFECRIIPVSDPTLKVEWMHNGNPLKQGKKMILSYIGKGCHQGKFFPATAKFFAIN